MLVYESVGVAYVASVVVMKLLSMVMLLCLKCLLDQDRYLSKFTRNGRDALN